jgi:CDP-glucose 4,6-dehydratase
MTPPIVNDRSAPADAFWAGKRVFVTGHTGFKGSWLAEWLLSLGAEVHGLSLPPDPGALFDQLGLAPRMDHRLGDVRDEAAVAACVRDVQPDFVFHLAAQALVRRSYVDPLETFTTNVLICYCVPPLLKQASTFQRLTPLS